VVDDEESVRRALGRLIRSFGFEAELFASGDALLASLPVREPQCVVLDLHMPGIDGFETQLRLAKAGRGIPVVVVTGHDTPEAHARALAGGAKAYLRKPVDQRTLFDAIREAVGAPSSPRANGK
jgi:FixJ family two-component response regulator